MAQNVDVCPFVPIYATFISDFDPFVSFSLFRVSAQFINTHLDPLSHVSESPNNQVHLKYLNTKYVKTIRYKHIQSITSMIDINFVNSFYYSTMVILKDSVEVSCNNDLQINKTASHQAYSSRTFAI